MAMLDSGRRRVYTNARVTQMIDKSEYTIRELADEAAKRGRPVTTGYLRQLCIKGTLRARKPGRDWMIPVTTVKAWLADWLKG